LFAYGQAQETDSLFNLSFEKIENGFPVNWYGKDFGDTLNYTVSLDSVNVKSGKYALTIAFTGDSLSSKSSLFVLPSYEGKKITLSGYVKAENITEGYARLWMQIAHRNEFDIIAYDNGKGLTGTSDWEKYEITLDLNPANTNRILFGGLLQGNGTMWMDDLKVTIDGKEVQQLEPYKPEPFPAENDKEFDSGSNIVFPELNKRHIHSLELLGRIWGFLKYHHPAIAKGNYNWDYELFRFLPEYLKTDDTTQRDELLLHWIDKLGNVPAYENHQPTTDSVFLKPDLSWIENSNMNRELKNSLQHIYQNRHQGHHYHIMMGYFGNPLFLNENTYAECPIPTQASGYWPYINTGTRYTIFSLPNT
jgi:hypothetical protein